MKSVNLESWVCWILQYVLNLGMRGILALLDHRDTMKYTERFHVAQMQDFGKAQLGKGGNRSPLSHTHHLGDRNK